MPRLTRAESQNRNRQVLLDAARERFLAEGYLATSIAKVADDAGFSTGVVYSNFGSKAELALHVLRDIQRERVAELDSIFRGSPGVEGKLDAFRQWAEQAMASGWPRLELEFALDVRTEDALVAAEADRQRSAVDHIAAAIEDQLPAGEPGGLVPVRALADSAVNLAIGLAVRRLIDPNVSVEHLLQLLRSLLTLIPR
ncbi:TetR/AcrR family transcriptional regulator [Haloechinothrix sp. YIM 98757]|uniref:TetR/AcrR family transcriptional regulator n=1 Tax=Haloechinothrix aidingensis TaxID=2752311 RepID=A0A838AF47_9PSEU|nr:TetR/AcrR family transcriptional regulator [Haloechinothrix aidingensis]MBA0127777.1 TetR/AcrR family transcriptional regulator [Haloechinothrix aidingensis]